MSVWWGKTQGAWVDERVVIKDAAKENEKKKRK
jgi:6-phosphogluconolactonase/glucosamine-6-phosphate isomerase/deaminase